MVLAFDAIKYTERGWASVRVRLREEGASCGPQTEGGSAVETSGADHADLAQALTELVRIHAYDRLMALTERTTEESSHGD